MQALGRRYCVRLSFVTAIALAGLAACRSVSMVAGTAADGEAVEAVSLLGERLFSPPIPAPTREIYEQRLSRTI